MKIKIPTKVKDFWEYYKWFVIVPVLIVIIIVCFVSTYIENTRPVSLAVALVNTDEVAVPMRAFQIDYPQEVELDEDLPVRVLYDLTHPSVINEQTAADMSMVAKVQKLQSMMLNQMVDVMIGTDWVLRDYERSDVFYDFRDIYPEEYLEKHKDELCYIPDSTGTPIPIGIYLENNEYLGKFHEDAIPVAAIPLNCTHPEEAKRFILWLTGDI